MTPAQKAAATRRANKAAAAPAPSQPSTGKPVIELRKVHESRSLSEETIAYTADVWVDGKLFCHVSNHGQGGSDMQHAPRGYVGNFHADLQALEARIKATFPAKTAEMRPGETFTYGPDLETVCSDLLADVSIAKTVRRDLAKKVMFVKPSDGGLYGVKIPSPQLREKIIEIVKTKHGIAQTLNEMPIEKAIEIYKAQ